MVGVPSLFPPGREYTINYDWIDIASATGYIVFDGFNAIDSTGDNYSLIESSHASSIVGASVGDASVVLQSVFIVASGEDCDLDFDLTPFQLPKTIEGKGFAQITVASTDTDAVTNSYVIAKLRKWNAATTTETEIVTVQSPTDASMAANHYNSWTLGLTIPRTHFKKGEQLRLTVLLYSSDAIPHRLAHNPDDTAVGQFAAGSSRLTLSIPFKLDFM